MIKFNEIALDFETRRELQSKFPPTYWECEMSDFDSAFLCGILRKFKPKKIVEVGIAGGGTTAVILKCLESIGQEYIMHSIDIALRYHLDHAKETGYAFKYAKENNIIPPPPQVNCKHYVHLGTILPAMIEEIGGDIDFVILDTAHVLPGEILDFIAVLPYLKKDAVVVLHDIMENQRVFKQADQQATAALFSAVVADKFFNFNTVFVDFMHNYPNIGAFQINEHTRANIENVFLTLVLRWSYSLPGDQLFAYYNIFQKHYDMQMCRLFEQALKMNYLNLKIDGEIKNLK